MIRETNLTEGSIAGGLFKLAMPLMATSFIQMAYNLTDLMWLGRLSTDALSAAGAVGFLIWFGSAIIMISQIGVGIHVAQSYGRNDILRARDYAESGLQFDLLAGLTYGLILYFFRQPIVGFFRLGSETINRMGIEYLSIIALGIVFSFLNPVLSNILNSTGNSLTPFKINTVGLIINIILDPLLIFGYGPIPAFGIKGAALATVSAQFVVTMIFVYVGRKTITIYSEVRLLSKPRMDLIGTIVKTGFPAFLQISIQAGVAILLARVITGFGPVGIAVQAIGSQVESLAWMTAEGFSAAISAFVGQNYGAKKYDRIDKGYKIGMAIVGSLGLATSLLLIFFGQPIFSVFTPTDPLAIIEGTKYLKILGYSQMLMSLEIGTAGLFNGIGKTSIPAMVAVSINPLRIPLAIFLSTTIGMGLSGIWWGISITSILKGIILPSIFIFKTRDKLLKGSL